jgi:hypothetical protein
VTEIVPTELEHVPEGRGAFNRAIAVLVGLVAVIASSLAIIEAHSKRHKDAAATLSQRLAVQIFADIGASSPYVSFRIATLQDANALELAATARKLSVFSHPAVSAIEAPRIAAEVAAARRITVIATQMAELPTAADGVDAETRRAVAATITDLGETVARQNRAVDIGDRYGRREERSILGLSLAASGAALLGLAGILGGRWQGRLLLGVAALALLVAGAAGVTALTI